MIAMRDKAQHRTIEPKAADLAVAAVGEIDLNLFAGQEKVIVQKYLDVDLLDKDYQDSKNARQSLGLGMPEVRAIHRRMKLPNSLGGTHVKTFREYIEWYKVSCNQVGSYGAHVNLQKCVISSPITAKLIALIRLAAIQMGQPIM